jgi:tight adherence protein B
MFASRTRRIGAAVAAVAAVAVAVLAPAATANASGPDGPRLVVSSFDGGGSRNGGRNTIQFTWTGPASDVTGLTVTENDRPVTLESKPTKLDRDRGVVFVVDSGAGMNGANLLPDVRDRILKAVRAHPGLEYAVVQAGDRADIRTNFTREPARIETALRAIGPTKDSAVWNALNQAASMYEDFPRLQANVVLVSADDDTVSAANAPVARSSVVANAVQQQTLLYGGTGTGVTDTGPYDLLVATYGTPLNVRADRSTLLDAIDGAVSAVADEQYTASWASTVADGESLRVGVSVGEQAETLDLLAGRGLTQGYQQLHPHVQDAPITLPFVDSKVALAFALVLALVGIAGGAYALTTALVKDDLSNVLQPYADAYSLIEGESDEGGSSMLGNSALMQKAVAFTEQVAENQGLLTRAEASLERANLPLRAGEALFGYAVLILVATVVPLLLTRNVVAGLIGGALATMLPVAVVNGVAKKRRKDFLSQLPDTLSLLSGTLKAGYSLMQGVEAVSGEVSEPMGLELRRVITESRLGRPLEESLDASAERMASPDFSWAVMAIRIQREVGGNLAELLMTVADTMVQRERLRRDVAALTAEGRVSAYMLAGMPPILAAVMYVLNKDYVSTLFTNTIGWVMVGLAAVSMVIGFLWMKKIITIEI